MKLFTFATKMVFSATKSEKNIQYLENVNDTIPDESYYKKLSLIGKLTFENSCRNDWSDILYKASFSYLFGFGISVRLIMV